MVNGIRIETSGANHVQLLLMSYLYNIAMETVVPKVVTSPSFKILMVWTSHE